MRTEIRPMTEQDLDAAASLLAERHRIDRTRSPVLSSRFDDPVTVRLQIAAALARPLAHGILATRAGEPVGFLIGTVSLPPPGAWYAGFGPRRSAEISYAGYAVGGPDPHETYREMYAALAPHFLRYGAFTHEIEVNAGDGPAIDAWFSLGFGQVATLAARDTEPVGGDASSPEPLEIRRASLDDIEDVVKLADELGRHHNAAPIFLPYLPEETSPGFRSYQLDLLAKPENAHWVGYRDGRAVAMQTFHEQDFAELARPDRSIYLFIGVTSPDVRGGGVGTALLRRSMAWAREAGYEFCTLHFLSANIPAARFWLKGGFRPLAQRLVRQVDERLAWANAQNERAAMG